MKSEDDELVAALDLEPGTLLGGKYRVERLLASGGMGAVAKARHEILDQDVAIKLMRPELAKNRELTQRFLREARAAARISSDYVARVTDVASLENGTPLMVMEFLQGDDLDTVMRREGPLPIEQAVDFVMQGLAGIEAAHKLGIVHRDLKPANLFVVRNEGSLRVKVLDFGISKAMETEASDSLKAGATTNVNALLGTPRYMSPEQVSCAKDVDGRTDIWAIGLILYEALTGRHPFSGDSPNALFAEILTAPIVSPRDIRPEIPEELDRLVLRCLARKRDHRFATPREVLRGLAPFASSRVRSALLDPSELVRVDDLAATAAAGLVGRGSVSGEEGVIARSNPPATKLPTSDATPGLGHVRSPSTEASASMAVDSGVSTSRSFAVVAGGVGFAALLGTVTVLWVAHVGPFRAEASTSPPSSAIHADPTVSPAAPTSQAEGPTVAPVSAAPASESSAPPEPAATEAPSARASSSALPRPMPQPSGAGNRGVRPAGPAKPPAKPSSRDPFESRD